MKRCTRFFLFLIASIFIFSETAFSQCNPIGQLQVLPYSVTTNSVIVDVPENSQVDYIFEYGLHGFTPGTDTTPGPGGTILQFPGLNSYDTITGLTADTRYNLYVRKKCSAIQFSVNSAVQFFKTQMICGSQVIQVNTLETATFDSSYGAWINCGGNGAEQVFQFTAPVSGMYVLFTDTFPEFAYFSYKEASGGCIPSGFFCIGSNWVIDTHQQEFGPLTAGTDYYLVVDPAFTDTNFSGRFRIEPPYCTRPDSVMQISSTPTSVTIQWNGSLSGGYIEYGPHKFIPGIGAGTVVSGGLSPSTLNNLFGQYDLYLRKSCGNGYSPFSQKIFINTAYCPQTFDYTPNFGGSLFSMSLNFYGMGYWDDYSANGCWHVTPGQEQVVTFTPPCTGDFNLRVNHGYNSIYNLMIRLADTICEPVGAQCLSPQNNDDYTDTFLISLTGGNTYELWFDIFDTSTQFYQTMDIRIDPPTPKLLSASDIQPGSVALSWNCNCNNAYIEYGPSGFTPGLHDTAGVNGTVIANVTSPYIITGLSPGTMYDFYVRGECAGAFSPNSKKLRQSSAFDCTNLELMQCGQGVIYHEYVSSVGAWENYGGGPTGNTGKESFYSFTPGQTGVYSLLIYNATSANYSSFLPTSFYYKPQPGVCNETGWTCLGTDTINLYQFIPVTFTTDTLLAGTTYLFMVDSKSSDQHAHHVWFRIDCPYVCSTPLLFYADSITPTSARINSYCSNCFGDVTLEYGLAGFTPGVDSIAGPGGTVIQHVTFPYTLTGLSLGTYDVYARQQCDALGSFSANSDTLSFITCSSPPDSIVTSAINNFFCLGDTVMLTHAGGELSPGGMFHWYSGSCGGTLIGTGDTITVFPVATSNYYVRAESPCGITNCKSKLIYEDNVPVPPINGQGFMQVCPGDTFEFRTLFVPGYSYQWMLNFQPIPGATNNTYDMTASGRYYVQITDLSGCQNNSAIRNVVSGCFQYVQSNSPRKSNVDADIPEFSVRVSPNPSSNDFTLLVTSEEKKNFTLLIRDIAGRFVVEWNSIAGGEQVIFGSNFPPGFYFAELTGGDEHIIIRLIKN